MIKVNNYKRLVHIFLVFFLLFTTINSIAQVKNARIYGKITTSDNQPAPSVNISLKDKSQATTTNERGDYVLRNLPNGSYTIEVSFVGLEKQERNVTLESGQQLEINFVLKENKNELEEVIISAHQNRTTSAYVGKMPLKILENAQVYNVVTSDLMRQQAVVNYDDALKNVPGITKMWEPSGRNSGSFFTLRGFDAQNTMINGLPGLANGSLDPANIEKIEVIKGPSSTLFGSPLVSYGGLINNVTKRPFDVFASEFAYNVGSFGTNRVTADINAPLDRGSGLLARINTAFQTEGSFQDQGFRKSFFIAPTISYKVNNRLSFLFMTEFLNEERSIPIMLRLNTSDPLTFKDMKDLNYNTKLSFTNNDLSIKSSNFNLQGLMTYKISDAWTSQTSIASGQSDSKGISPYLSENSGYRDFVLEVTRSNAHNNNIDIQQNFMGDFKIGQFRNRLTFGLDYYNTNQNSYGTGFEKVHNVDPQGNINYFTGTMEDENGNYVRDTNEYRVEYSLPAIENLLGNSEASGYKTVYNIYSAYANDVFNITPGLLISAGVRADRYVFAGTPEFDEAGYKQTAISPKFGLIYQPVLDKISIFANYQNGFQNVAPAQVYDEEGDPTGQVRIFKPEQAKQLEFGIKSNLLNDKLTATVSYYDIKVSNMVIQDGDNFYNSIQGGRTRSKGFEADINTVPVKGLNIIAGFSYNDSKFLEGVLDRTPYEVGKRPYSAGPDKLANFWASYTFNNGNVKGLGLALGGNYASANAVVNNSTTGYFAVPSYTVLNGSLFYDTKKVRFGLNLNNITNEVYYVGGWGTIAPQKPRNITGSIVFKLSGRNREKRYDDRDYDRDRNYDRNRDRDRDDNRRNY